MEGFVDYRDSGGDSVVVYREAKVVVTRATSMLR
jgi:hypothetical protein